jgi:hypothetical protein
MKKPIYQPNIPKKSPKTQNQIELKFYFLALIYFIDNIEVQNNLHQTFLIEWNL